MSETLSALKTLVHTSTFIRKEKKNHSLFSCWADNLDIVWQIQFEVHNRKTNKKSPSLLPLTIFSLCLGYCDNGFVPVGPTGGWETLGLCIFQRCCIEWWESQRKWRILKFFLTISVALIEDIISVCESCHTLGLKSDEFTALNFKKVEEQHYEFEFRGFFYVFNMVITRGEKNPSTWVWVQMGSESHGQSYILKFVEIHIIHICVCIY